MIHVRKEDIVTARSNYCTHMDTPQDFMKAEKTERRGERKKGNKEIKNQQEKQRKTEREESTSDT